jgi:predicted Rossmann-fold nucleotide-binding protein
MSRARGTLKIVEGKRPTEDFGNIVKGKKPAVILTNENSCRVLVGRMQEFCVRNGFDTRILDCTNENLIAAAKIVKIGERKKSVCYIAGASEGNDNEIKIAVTDLAQKIAQNGYHAIWPGSKYGMMGVLARAVMGAGKPIASVFSLDVAQAHIEELEGGASSIVVAPSERERQLLYHLLSGAQIALPGGGGTHAEAAIHFYQNGQMGLMYRRPDAFTEHNYPSPIIYFSPATSKTNQRIKAQMADLFPDLKSDILSSNVENLGYWAFEQAQFKLMMRSGFLSPNAGALIQFAQDPEKILEILAQWEDDGVRARITGELSVHLAEVRERMEKIKEMGLRL